MTKKNQRSDRLDWSFGLSEGLNLVNLGRTKKIKKSVYK